jgi:hypothetical protein
VGAARFRIGTVGGVVDRVSDRSVEDVHTHRILVATPAGAGCVAGAGRWRPMPGQCVRAA